MNIALSDEQISDLLDHQIPIMPYSELIEKGLMNVLRETPSKAVVFLVRQKPDYGHWCLCWLKTKGNEQGLHCYDSYGNEPDSKEWKRNLTKKTLKQLNQENPYLLSQLYESGKSIYFNEYQHQDINRNIATCGRHVVCRACFLDLDTDEYNDMITSKGMSPDQVVLNATDNYLI
jgi:hypothetical protein